MSSRSAVPIPGTPGRAWTVTERNLWRQQQRKRRSYADEVLGRIDALGRGFEVVRYGELNYPPDGRYPLFSIRNRTWTESLPTALVTGGVHGYETSGVMGALQFAEKYAGEYAGKLNLLIAPCVSPWAFERIQRWNPDAIDPNRSFYADSPAAESAALWNLVNPLRGNFIVHIDLHETTDTDESEFRPALAARDGVPFAPGTIPDGFYLVDDTENPQPEFQNAIIDAVSQVTHIAPADADGTIIGSDVVAHGLIRYPLKRLGLCASITGARYTTTTEVYPDSPRVSPEQCSAAQVAAVRAALDFALANPAS
ncbi:MAG: peptidase [Gammaproteobacteria bacterium]|nr:MAG: peptidase [Gammaproteobacteria bacterium]